MIERVRSVAVVGAVVGAIIVAMVVAASSAAGAPSSGAVGTVAKKPTEPPCAGCIVEVPKAMKGDVPLLVILHGDRERAGSAIERWRAAARERGWAIFAPQCPTSEGCRDSWWRWDGDPSWLDSQIEKLNFSIDRQRIVLVGWSGGASYVGLRAQTWVARFSAVVIHGGGMAPETEGCPDRGLPAYFLVGDTNPLHQLMKDLRAHFDACKHEVVWDLVRGADHEREERALDKAKALAILDWLHARPRTKVP